jgi:two-component system cell cycle response regulator
MMIAALTDPLECEGFNVESCSSGPAALMALERDFRPIVVIDRSMPGFSGIDLCEEIRRRKWPGYVYIILHTGRDDEEAILEGLKAGADDYVSKRSSTAQLIARLRVGQRITTLERSLKSAIRESSRMANTDALTGAPNRRYFNKRIARDLRASRRADRSLSLLLLDIDDFKIVNDRFGHPAGDEVLIELVKRVRGLLPRDSDWMARLGGEEFAVILPFTGAAGAQVVAERLRRDIAGQPIRTGYGDHPITVSIGIGSVNRPDTSDPQLVDDLLVQADAFLYMSKNDGRNRVSGATDHLELAARGTSGSSR